MLVFLNGIYENNKVQVDVIYLNLQPGFPQQSTTKTLVYWYYQRPMVMIQVLSPQKVPVCSHK